MKMARFASVFCMPVLTLSALLMAPSTSSAKTIMWLGNWFQNGTFQNGDIGGVDSVWVAKTDSSGSNGYYYGVANQKLTKATTAYVDTSMTHSANVNWWSIPVWSATNYRELRFRMTISYKKFNGPVANPVYQADRNETQEMNGRYTNTPNIIDSACLDQIPGDTAWMYWGLGSISDAQKAPICSDHNPYLKPVGTIHLLNPWPGKTAYVKFNGGWLPLYGEPGRPGWVTASFFALPTAVLDQKLVFASADPTKSSDIQYMDQTGIGAVSNASPWDMGTLAWKWERWIAPAVDGTSAPKVLTSAPALSRTLMVRLPTWGASAIRVTWKGVPGRFIAQSTSYCEWFAINFYQGLVPSSIVLNHPFQDTVYGSKGLQVAPADFSAYTDWITVPTAGTDTLWLNTNGAPAILPIKPPSSETKVCNQKLLAFQVFDFKIKGPYFPFKQDNPAPDLNSDLLKGLVGQTLGADGLPTYTKKSICGANYANRTDKNCTDPANGPNNWFKSSKYNTTGCLQQPLLLNSATGQYEYSSGAYFPLDTLIKDSAFNEKLAGTQAQDFGFCMHAKSTFEYVRGLTFSFSGDDDVWVFINRKLALDLGGQHGPQSGSIDLDRQSLSEGHAYQFDMFYCERHTPGSNIKIQTTMNLVPSYDFIFDSTSVTQNQIQIDLKYIKTEIDGSKCQEASTQTPVAGKGYFFMQYPDGHLEAIVPPPGKSQFSGIQISSDLSSVKVDLDAVKKNSQLTQRGTYKIVVRFQNDASQANAKEIPFDITSGPVNLSADLYDVDGDGKPDSLVVRSEDATFTGTDLKRTGIVWTKVGGSRDSVVLAGTSAVSSTSGTEAIYAWTSATTPFMKGSSCPNGGCVNPGVAITYPSASPDTNRNPIKVLREHVAPFADSARISFGDAGAADTLRIWLGEGAMKNPAATASDVWAAIGRRTASRNLSATDATIVAGGREIRLILPAGHGIGNSDSLRVAGLVADSLSNPSTGSSVWVPIRSSPLGTAALFDADGDGQADSLSVSVRGALTGVKSVQLDWKDVSGASIRRTWPLTGAVNGSFGVSTNSLAFPKNATSCPGADCQVAFLDASDKIIETWPLLDSVAPAALRGVYLFGDSYDTLCVRSSEALKSVTNLPSWVEWGSGGALAAPVMHSGVVPQALSDSVCFALDTANAVRPSYDSIRMASGLRAGNVSDKGGKTVGKSSPWAPISFGVPPMRAYLRDPSGAGRGTVLEIKPIRSVPAAAIASIGSLNVVWNDTFGQISTRDVAFSSMTQSGNSWTTSLASPFDFGATGCLSGNCHVVATSPVAGSRQWELFDGIPPVLVRAKLHFAATEENADTLFIRSSEVWVQANTTDQAPFVAVGTPSRPTDLSMVSWELAANGRDAYIVIDSNASKKILRADSARFIGGAAAKVRDLENNRPLDLSPWTPIEFGLRPFILRMAAFPGGGVLKNTEKTGGRTWDPPVLGTPSTEILVADAEGTNLAANPELSRYKTPDGKDPVNDLTKVLAVRVLLNRPLEGRLFIYDNIGTHVANADLGGMRSAWLADTTKKDQMREVWLVWNGTGMDGKFASSGVYVFRAFVKVDKDNGQTTFQNLIWKLGWHRDVK